MRASAIRRRRRPCTGGRWTWRRATWRSSSAWSPCTSGPATCRSWCRCWRPRPTRPPTPATRSGRRSLRVKVADLYARSLNNPQKAISIYRHVADQDPGNVQAHLALADLFMRDAAAGPMAIEEHRNVLRLDPTRGGQPARPLPALGRPAAARQGLLRGQRADLPARRQRGRGRVLQRGAQPPPRRAPGADPAAGPGRADAPAGAQHAGGGAARGGRPAGQALPARLRGAGHRPQGGPAQAGPRGVQGHPLGGAGVRRGGAGGVPGAPRAHHPGDHRAAGGVRGPGRGAALQRPRAEVHHRPGGAGAGEQDRGAEQADGGGGGGRAGQLGAGSTRRASTGWAAATRSW